MSSAARTRPAGTAAAFGAGRGEPYRRVLAGGSRAGALSLRDADGISHPLDAGSWVGPAGGADLSVIERIAGPVLDVGCGPGRMLHAIAARALPALGVDVAWPAVAIARSAGALVLQRSVFDRLPLEGAWRTVLLMDGNIGIGGAPDDLLRRCASLVAPEGSVIVEVDADADLEVVSTCTLVDDDGNESDPFPWARVGWRAVRGVAVRSGLHVVEHWHAAGRHFVRTAPPGRARRARDIPSAVAATAASTTQMAASARP